jgi:hypothetical protein
MMTLTPRTTLSALTILAMFSIMTVAAPTRAQVETDDAEAAPFLFDPALATADALFDGARAMAMVRDFDAHWRWPGNDGFEASIDRLETELVDAGYMEESNAGADDRLTYRIESYPMNSPTWDPLDATLTLAGDEEPLLRFATNRNMIAIHSASTPEAGVTADIVDIGAGRDEDYERIDVEGRIVLTTASPGRAVRDAVMRRGAVGVLSFNLPAYNDAANHVESITFHMIAPDPSGDAWALSLSHRAYTTIRERLAAGATSATVHVSTKRYTRDERVIIAEVRGTSHAHERFVFSAHVQEPGANDNATGMATQAEIARAAATALRAGDVDPKRTITFLWGNEIGAIARYLRQDDERTKHIRWGISLDMVGEDTTKTGGTFLIEKMPDPSAVWTRGDDRHTEWGGWPISKDRLKPHYFNDLMKLCVARRAAATGWEFRMNPYEGGSDHVPFLRAGVPGLLLWHFTDVYYHTDGDRPEMVSPATMKNVGVCALAMAFTLTDPAEDCATRLVSELVNAFFERIHAEVGNLPQAVAAGGTIAEEREIREAWVSWYIGAVATTSDIPVQTEAVLADRILQATLTISRMGDTLIQALGDDE